MTKKDFETMLNEAVANGADPKEAEAYIRAGFKVDEDANGQEKLASAKAPAKKPTSKETEK